MLEVTTMFFVLVFIGCVNAQFTQKMWEVARSKRVKGLSCDVDSSVSLGSSAIHWYRARPGEGLERIVHFPAGSTSATSEAGLKSYSGSIMGHRISLTILTVTKDDEATYFCALWKGDEKVFSSGTRLYVKDGANSLVIKPKVSTYINNDKGNGKSVLLCQASAMFPPIVKITWKATDENNAEVSVPGADEELLEQKDEGQEVNMLIVPHQKASSHRFTCNVQHSAEVTAEEMPVQAGEEKDGVTPSPDLVQTCPPPKVKQEVKVEGEGEEEESEDQEKEFIWGSPGRSLYLFKLSYVVLLLKNVLYFCFINVILYKRKSLGKEPSKSKT